MSGNAARAPLAAPHPGWRLPLALFTRRWIVKTFFVLLVMAGMTRLGIWQLDRLEQRRAFNSRVQAQLDQPPLTITGGALDANLGNMEYRQASVTGVYDFSQEVALLNQADGNQLGVHLITPLIVEDSQRALLVDRGWIPEEDYRAGDWTKFQEPGVVTVSGVLRASKDRPDFGWRSDPLPAPGGERDSAWYFVNIPALQLQTPYDLLPAYLQAAPNPTWDGLPKRSQPELELSEGPHLGYAIQWFTFALVGGVGYLLYVHKRLAPIG